MSAARRKSALWCDFRVDDTCIPLLVHGLQLVGWEEWQPRLVSVCQLSRLLSHSNGAVFGSLNLPS